MKIRKLLLVISFVSLFALLASNQGVLAAERVVRLTVPGCV